MANIIITAKLWVLNGNFAKFEDYETRAFEIMKRYGGEVLSVEQNHSARGTTPHEVHELTFPNKAAFNAYRADPNLLAMAELREDCIEKTEIVFS